LHRNSATKQLLKRSIMFHSKTIKSVTGELGSLACSLRDFFPDK